MRQTDGTTVEIKMGALRGRQVRTRRDMQNAYTKVPAGTIVRAAGSWRSGVNIETPKCEHCGVSVFIGKVHRDDLELVPDEPQLTCKCGHPASDHILGTDDNAGDTRCTLDMCPCEMFFADEDNE